MRAMGWIAAVATVLVSTMPNNGAAMCIKDPKENLRFSDGYSEVVTGGTCTGGYVDCNSGGCNAEDKGVQACGITCKEKHGPTGAKWSGYFAYGYKGLTTKGNCLCYTSTDGCTVEKDTWGYYKNYRFDRESFSVPCYRTLCKHKTAVGCSTILASAFSLNSRTCIRPHADLNV